MAEKKCKSCAMMIPKEAKICPHCRKRQGLTILKVFGYFLVILFFIGILSTIIGEIKSTKNKQITTEGIDSIDVYIAAKKFMEQRLKQPHTANFAAHLISDVKQINQDTFEVISYVDSQNDFGVSIRINFKCKIKHLGNKKWALIDLQNN